MSNHAGMLDYFGPQPRPRRGLIGTCWAAICFLVRFIIVTAWITLRAALLIIGLALVMLGSTILLLAGQRSAARAFARWRSRSADVMRLWLADIIRPLRRSRARQPMPVQMIP